MFNLCFKVNILLLLNLILNIFNNQHWNCYYRLLSWNRTYKLVFSNDRCSINFFKYYIYFNINKERIIFYI